MIRKELVTFRREGDRLHVLIGQEQRKSPPLTVKSALDMAKAIIKACERHTPPPVEIEYDDELSNLSS